MSAGGVELVLDVQGAEAGLLHEHVLLEQTEAADVKAGAVRGGPGNQGPLDLEPPFHPLQIPHILPEAGVGLLLDVLGRLVVSAGLTVGLGSPQVCLHLQQPGVPLDLILQLRPLWSQCLDLCFVDDVLCQTLASQWTAGLVLLGAAALSLSQGRLTLADGLLVVPGNDVTNIR